MTASFRRGYAILRAEEKGDMEETTILNDELLSMVSRLHSRNRQALAKYALFLLDAQETEQPRRQAEKEAAFESLEKFYGILGDVDPGEILAEAMREKYGSVPRREHDCVR